MAMNEQQTIRAIFAGGHTVAVVGLSPKAWRESFGVSRAMQAAGWRIIPVNPAVAELSLFRRHPRAAARARAAGLNVVQDRCLKVEWMMRDRPST